MHAEWLQMAWTAVPKFDDGKNGRIGEDLLCGICPTDGRAPEAAR